MTKKKIMLQLNTSKEVDLDLIDSDVMKDLLQEIEAEDVDNPANQEIRDAIFHLLDNDMESLIDMEDIKAQDFTVTVEDAPDDTADSVR
jgi:hypothetical protein